MNKLSTMEVVFGCITIIGCTESGSYATGGGPAPRVSSSGPAVTQYSTGVDTSMPGSRGGFNNDDINGKSRNPYSTTPGTGPMNANPVSSGNVPR